MNGCLLVVNWNDVINGLAHADITLNPILIGRALLKQVGLRVRLQQAHAVGDWSSPEGAAAGAMLQRLGFLTHPVAAGAGPAAVDQAVASILRQIAAFDELLLIAGPESAHAAISSL